MSVDFIYIYSLRDSEIPYKAVDAETLNVLSCVPLVHVDKSNSCIYNSASTLGIQRSASQNVSNGLMRITFELSVSVMIKWAYLTDVCTFKMSFTTCLILIHLCRFRDLFTCAPDV